MKRLFVILAGLALFSLAPVTVSGASDQVFSGTLSGAAEVPPVNTTAGGTAYVFIDPAGTEIKYAVSYTGLSGPVIAAHIHYGPPGVSGQIMFPLIAGPSTMFGSLTAANFQATSSAPTWEAALAAIRAGNSYLNLHTAAHPQGEVRAQLLPTAGTATPQPTTSPTAAPAATAGGTVAPTHKSLPPTSTAPVLDRQGGSPDLALVLLLLLLGVIGGIAATWRIKPSQRGSPPQD
ncbi:MAG TPA: CHRD domain-containing protein [Candidatus Saccharimonadales bacterium]|nr:CHRD domain-containing protein [Candidatus Saccharimonadales bacterium]